CGMRIALGQKPEMGGEQLHAVDAGGAGEKTCGVELQRLRLEDAEVLIKPRPPDEIDPVARLKKRLHATRTAAAHEAEVTAMRRRHPLQYDACLAMPAGSKDDSLVAPFHGRTIHFEASEIKMCMDDADGYRHIWSECA